MAERVEAIRFEQIGDSLTRAMASGDRPLESNGGRAHTIFHLTVNNLRQRCVPLQVGAPDVERIVQNAEAQLAKGIALCESPIECMVLAALINADWWGFGSIPPVVHDARKDAVFPHTDVVIIPQFAFARHRMDFGIYARHGDHSRIAAVECDGKEFHDPAKDFARDEYLKSWSIETYRMSGRDIHFDPIKAVIPAVYSFTDWKKELEAKFEKASTT